MKRFYRTYFPQTDAAARRDLKIAMQHMDPHLLRDLGLIDALWDPKDRQQLPF